jgi:hypothetical protein
MISDILLKYSVAFSFFSVELILQFESKKKTNKRKKLKKVFIKSRLISDTQFFIAANVEHCRSLGISCSVCLVMLTIKERLFIVSTKPACGTKCVANHRRRINKWSRRKLKIGSEMMLRINCPPELRQCFVSSIALRSV